MRLRPRLEDIAGFVEFVMVEMVGKGEEWLGVRGRRRGEVGEGSGMTGEE